MVLIVSRVNIAMDRNNNIIIAVPVACNERITYRIADVPLELSVSYTTCGQVPFLITAGKQNSNSGLFLTELSILFIAVYRSGPRSHTWPKN